MSTPPAAVMPSWPYCAHGSDPTADPVGCRGIHVPGHTACLAHLTDTDRDAYLAGLTSGADIDHRGTPLTEMLLDQLLSALRDPSTGNPQMGTAKFNGARFSGTAKFGRAQFSGLATFDRTQFSREARFGGAQVSHNAWFSEAKFVMAPELGPLVCSGQVNLSGAVFEGPVTLEIAARKVLCTRTRWESTAAVRLRYAMADLGHAVLSAPVAVTAHPAPFTSRPWVPIDESPLSGCSDAVRVISVQGVDAAQLVLIDTDLSGCLFSGAFHLDQLRLEGRTVFAPTPTGWHRRGIRLTRWTRRRTLAEEHHWRAHAASQPPLLPGHTLSLACGAPARTTQPLRSPPAPRTLPSCTGSSAKPSRTARTNPAPPTSITASARCAATTAQAPPRANAACCGATGCCPATACAPPAPSPGCSPR